MNTHTRTDTQTHALQFGAVQHSTVQYSTVQYSTVQYSTVQNNGCAHHSFKQIPSRFSSDVHVPSPPRLQLHLRSAGR